MLPIFTVSSLLTKENHLLKTNNCHMQEREREREGERERRERERERGRERYNAL